MSPTLEEKAIRSSPGDQAMLSMCALVASFVRCPHEGSIVQSWPPDVTHAVSFPLCDQAAKSPGPTPAFDA